MESCEGEVMHSYKLGMGNHEMLSRYGFILEDNPYTTTEIVSSTRTALDGQSFTSVEENILA